MAGGTPSIEKAWEAYKTLLLSQATPDVVEECRVAYWAGAATLFYAIMLHGLDDGDEPTNADLMRMDNIHNQVDRFAKTFDAEALRRMKAEIA